MGIPNAPWVRRKALVGGVDGLELCQFGTQVIKKRRLNAMESVNLNLVQNLVVTSTHISQERET